MNLKSKVLILLSIFIGLTIGVKADAPVQSFGEIASFRTASEMLDDVIIREASGQLEKTISGYSDRLMDDKSAMLLADIDMYEKNYQVADRKLEDFIRNRSNSPFVPFASFIRSCMAFQNKNYKLADTLFGATKIYAKRDFEYRKDSAYYTLAHDATFWQGVSRFYLGNFDEAQPCFEECYRVYPDGGYADDALFALGLSSEIKDNYDVAITYYNTLVKKYPYTNNYVSARIREANNYLILRDPTKAIFALDNAINVLDRIEKQTDDGPKYEAQTNIDGAREEALYLKAEAYNLAENYTSAEQAYNEFIDKYPTSKILDYAEIGLARVSMDLGKYDKAIYYFNEIIERDNVLQPKIVASAKLFRAVSLKKSGDTEQAKKDLASLTVQPDFPLLSDALLELGQVNYELGDYESSIRNLQRAERECGAVDETVKIKMLLGANYMEERKWDAACNEFKQAEQAATKASDLLLAKKSWYISEARFKQGIALVNNSQYQEAIPTLQSFVASATDTANAEEALFWIAEAYYRTDMLTNAISSYSNLLKKYPGSNRKEDALYGLGWSYFRLKKFDSSSETFEKMIKEFPQSKYAVEVLARQGDGYYVTKQFSKAITSYEKALSYDSKSDEALYCCYQICHASYKMGDYDQAVGKLMDFIKKYPNSSYADNALYLVGWIRFQQKNYSGAIENFRYLLDAYPSSSLGVSAQYTIGDAFYNEGKYDDAIAAYKRIVEKFPGHPLAGEALRSIQYCLESEGKSDEALRITDTFIAANPESPFAEEFEFKKGEMFYSGSKYSDAVNEYEHFLKQYPQSEKSAEAVYWMAKSYMSMNDTANTIRCFDEVVNKYPKSEFAPQSLLDHGVFEEEINQPVKAETLFRKLMTDYPDNDNCAQAGFEISTMRINMGDTTGGIKVLYDVLNKFPNNEYSEQSRYRIAMYYKLNGVNDSALKHFEVLSRSETNYELAAEALYRIGEIYVAEKNDDKAIVYFQTIREKFGGIEDWYSLGLLSLGECYERKNEYINAKDVYSALSALRPDDEYGAEAERRIEEIEKKLK